MQHIVLILISILTYKDNTQLKQVFTNSEYQIIKVYLLQNNHLGMRGGGSGEDRNGDGNGNGQGGGGDRGAVGAT